MAPVALDDALWIAANNVYEQGAGEFMFPGRVDLRGLCACANSTSARGLSAP